MSVKTSQLSSGLKIVYEKAKNPLAMTTFYVFCCIGSANETEPIRGASHLIEHMCFKGTKKMPRAKDISSEYDKIGAYFNAFTEKRYTCYTVKCQDVFVEHCIQILSDIMLNSVFKESEYEKEHKVVMEENRAIENDAQNTIFEETAKLIFEGSSFQYPIDSLNYHTSGHLSYEKVLSVYKASYRPENMIFSVISNLPIRTFERILRKTEFSKPSKERSCDGISAIQHGLSEQRELRFSKIHKPGVKNTLLTIGFRTCSYHSPDKHVLYVLRQILSVGMSSRLFSELREKRGLVYSSSVNTDYFDQTGSFTFFTQTDNHKVMRNKGKPGVVPALLRMINDLVEKGVSMAELKDAKTAIQGNIMLSLETNVSQVLHNGEAVLMRLGDEPIISYESLYDMYYSKVTCEDIKEVVRKYFRQESMSVTLLSS
jgi:predicted Zn-dependent peptidase